MKLPISLPFGKTEKQKYILALLLRDEKISAIITEEVEGKMRIVGQHEEMLTRSLEELSQEEWLDVLDRTISRAEETLPPDRETHDTVFGVKESWVEEKKIKKEYLMKLKKLSETLSLTPIGFLVISEAISHLMEAEEGAPVSAILVDIGNGAVTATLIRGGRILETHTVPKGEALPETVDTALKHITSVEVFPSRLVLFAGHIGRNEKEKHDHLAQQFISHHWSKSLPFMHVPQISVLAPGFDARAVVQGAASQMGFEVLNLTTSGEDEIRTYDQQERATEKGAADEEKTAKKSKKEEKDAAEETTVPEDTLSDDSEEKETTAKGTDLPTEDFGFVMDEDISKHARHVDKKDQEAAVSEHEVDHSTQHPHHESAEEHHEADTSDQENVSPIARLTGLVAALPLNRLTAALPIKKLRLTSLSAGPRNKFLLLPLIVLLLLIGGYFFYTAKVTADVTLYLKPNNVSETADVLFSTDAGNNFSDGTIAAQTVGVDLDGTVSGQVTGKKKIGEKAKGTVTIFNNDDSKRQLTAGTTITTEKGLKFTLDKDVSVASASGDIFSGTKPGTAQVAVTAAEIGTDYNLPSGTKFNVASGSNIAAKNDTAFSGGSEKNVTVVSKKDQDKLSSDLSKSLQSNALAQLAKKATGDEKLLSYLTQAEATKKAFDHKVDQEAKTLKLNGTVSYEALVYHEKDIKDFAEVSLKNKYGDNLNLSEKGVTYEIKNIKQKGEGEVAAAVTIQGGLVPRLDTDTLRSQLKGKSVNEAEEALKKIPQVGHAEIKLSPPIPLLSVFLPKAADRIQIKTALDE